MANILDKKQDVIQFELTSKGRKALANGNLKPSFVSFFDDDIIYNLEFVGGSEEQNATATRIIDESISIGILNTLSDSLIYQIGKTGLENDTPPKWSLSMLGGTINSSFIKPSKYYPLPNTKNKYYCQNLNLDPIRTTYSIAAEQEFSEESITYQLGDEILKIDNDYILIDLQEKNIEDEYKNFEIELWAADLNCGTKLFRQLNFESKPNNIIDGIIYDESEISTNFRKEKLNSKNSDYYFDILVDNEIDRQFLTFRKRGVKEAVEGTYTSRTAVPIDPCEEDLF